MQNDSDQIRPTPFAIKLDVLTQGFIIDTMVGGDETQTQAVKSKVIEGIQELKEEMEALPDIIPGGEPHDKRKPDVIFLLLQRSIDTILLEEVTSVGLKMNDYKALLAQGILKFAEEHQENRANMDRLVDAFRASWKVYRECEDGKRTMDVFMKEMNSQLRIPEKLRKIRDCARDE